LSVLQYLSRCALLKAPTWAGAALTNWNAWHFVAVVNSGVFMSLMSPRSSIPAVQAESALCPPTPPKK
jgi:hypothetical protein